MPNKNYLKGVRAERLAKKELEASGYYVMRASGSHSKFDLCAVDINFTRLIQIKNMGNARAKHGMWAEIKKLEEVKPFVHNNCRIELWIRRFAKWEKITI